MHFRLYIRCPGPFVSYLIVLILAFAWTAVGSVAFSGRSTAGTAGSLWDEGESVNNKEPLACLILNSYRGLCYENNGNRQRYPGALARAHGKPSQSPVISSVGLRGK